jgi:hypothetical protein
LRNGQGKRPTQARVTVQATHQMADVHEKLRSAARSGSKTAPRAGVCPTLHHRLFSAL